MFTGTIFNLNEEPRTSPPAGSRREAKLWCARNGAFEDTVYVITEDGKVIEGAHIEGMWESDPEGWPSDL
jgi:hypothetical protein